MIALIIFGVFLGGLPVLFTILNIIDIKKFSRKRLDVGEKEYLKPNLRSY